MTEPELDPFDSPEFREWAQDVLESMVPKLAESTFTISLFPRGGETDVKYAVELGYSIMLDKPILLLVDKRMRDKIPAKLRIVADRIVEIDWDGHVGNQIQQQVEDFISYVEHLNRVRGERDVD